MQITPKILLDIMSEAAGLPVRAETDAEARQRKCEEMELVQRGLDCLSDIGLMTPDEIEYLARSIRSTQRLDS